MAQDPIKVSNVSVGDVLVIDHDSYSDTPRNVIVTRTQADNLALWINDPAAAPCWLSSDAKLKWQRSIHPVLGGCLHPVIHRPDR